MRIVGGRFKGQRINAPKGNETRPTTDRTRESLFNILQNRMDLDGLRILDLFAGSGALGLESISRGAGFCLFVEEAGKARACIRENIETLGLTGQTKIFRRDATRLGHIGTMHPFDLIFADPPYGKDLGKRAARAIRSGNWIVPNGVFVLEESKQAFPESIEGFDLIDRRDFGDTTIGLFEVDTP